MHRFIGHRHHSAAPVVSKLQTIPKPSQTSINQQSTYIFWQENTIKAGVKTAFFIPTIPGFAFHLSEIRCRSIQPAGDYYRTDLEINSSSYANSKTQGMVDTRFFADVLTNGNRNRGDQITSVLQLDMWFPKQDTIQIFASTNAPVGTTGQTLGLALVGTIIPMKDRLLA